MIIFKNSNTVNLANWFTDKPASHGKLSTAQANRVVAMATDLDEEGVLMEMDHIEKCAAAKSPYHYSTKWSQPVVAKLREYCLACECPFQAVDPDGQEVAEAATEQNTETKQAIEQLASAEKKMVKTASASGLVVEKEQQTISLGDVFNFDKYSDMSHMAKENWQVVASPTKSASSFFTSGSISKIGGGEDYNSNQHSRVRPGQNSIFSPNAIEKLAESTELSQKQASKKAAEDYAMQVKAEKRESEKKAMDIAESLAEYTNRPGNIFVTDSMNAQSGLGLTAQTTLMYSGKDAIPDKTDGEMIAKNNEAKKASIQRPVKTAKTWETLPQSTKPSISDDFFSELENKMKK